MGKCLQSTRFLGESPFIQLPKAINAMKMSSDAKLLYANLADMLKLSEKNGYRDEQGLYAFCSLEYMQELLGCSRSRIITVLDELEEWNLISRRRMGQGKPNRYYLMMPKETESSILLVEETQKYENQTSELQKSEIDTFSMVDRSFLESIFANF